jgi:hypothetical protein
MWEDIIGYEGVYSISSDGKVRREKATNGTWSGRILKNKTDQDGYKFIGLSYGGKVRHFKIHRLVVEAFSGKPKDLKQQVNHKDGDKANNHIANLEWCSQSENERHAIDVLGVRLGCQGEKNPRTKLNENKVLHIRSLIEGGVTQRKVAEKFKISQGAVSDICTRRKWAHI